MTALWAILFFVLAMAPLVFLHELGHYWAGRLFGVHAEAFSIGFGRPLARWRDRRGTDWRVGWLPLGGYVRFAGVMTPEAGGRPARDDALDAKPAWQRALIVLAGPAANFLFAIAMLAALFAAVGEPRVAPVVGALERGGAAAVAGLKVGDRITGVNGARVQGFEDIFLAVQVRAGKPTSLEVERGGQPLQFTVTPRPVVITDLAGAKVPVGRVGIAPPPVEHVRLPLTELPSAATRFTVQSVTMMARALGQVVTGQRSVAELGGPVKIAAVSNKMAQVGLVAFLFFMVAVSINLGFINLLPVPMLDGGHLVFLAAEGLRGQPVAASAQEFAYRSGLALLLAFTLFVTMNDLGGLGVWSRLAGLIG